MRLNVRNAPAALALQFLAFVAAGIAVAFPSLSYPWHGDDLHLIRTFSAGELAFVWHHNWDLDGVETMGYRPLTVLFNHARAWLFGEAVMAHRLFLIGLYATYLVIIGAVARRFGLSRIAMTLAGVMILCAKYSGYHFVWISDGVHIAQGLLFALAALAILRWVESGAPGWYGASIAAALLSVLVREDSLGVLPVLIVMAGVHSWQSGQWKPQRAGLVGYAAVLAAISAATLLVRQTIVSGLVAPPSTRSDEVLAYILEMVTLAGWQPRLWMAVFIGVLALALLVVRRLERPNSRMAWLWLFFAVVAGSPGLVETRVNLLFFPITFYCIFLAQVVVRLANQPAVPGATWNKPAAVTLVLVCVLIPARESRLQQLSMAPGSIMHLEVSCNVALDGEWSRVTPPAKRALIEQELSRLHMDRQACEALLDESQSAPGERALPAGVFAPSRRFLTR